MLALYIIVGLLILIYLSIAVLVFVVNIKRTNPGLFNLAFGWPYNICKVLKEMLIIPCPLCGYTWRDKRSNNLYCANKDCTNYKG